MPRDLRAGEFAYGDRTDDVATKYELLQKAQVAGNYSLALALADSIKDTLSNERMLGENPGTPVVRADDWRPVVDLPGPWARWAEGWSLCKELSLAERAGQARAAEAVDLLVAMPTDQVDWPARELRVARLDQGRPVEVRSQVYGEVRRGRAWLAHLVFEADAPARGQTSFLIFCGNPGAELPQYQSELRVTGQGFGLDIENSHYIASLSRQMGQLEKLRAKWHMAGLELAVGGVGHGEPPNLDWAHDYLASQYFQKFRITSWESCPNYEVVQGPVCAIVRRFGFPHSQVHPLFTPARFFIDVKYTFYATAPYFLKDGRMEATQDFTLNYSRDDEWLMAGRLFTHPLWMDEAGHIHEGDVPAEHADRLWGVGFFNQDSRESFFAIHLAHDLDVPPGAGPDAASGVTVYHAGTPSNYGLESSGALGHGQIWSRWVVRGDPKFTAGLALVQRNAYLFAPYPAGTGAAGLEALRERLLHPLTPESTTDGVLAAGALPGEGRLARLGEGTEARERKRTIWAALREVRDDQFYKVDANPVDMGYIYDVRVRGQDVYILMTLAHKGRPKYDFIANPIRDRVARIPGVRSVTVDLTWEPAWTPNRLTDAGRRVMGLDA